MDRRVTSKRAIAGIVTAILAILGALGAGVSGLSSSGDTSGRVRVLEVRAEGIDQRLERIENKIDRLIERK